MTPLDAFRELVMRVGAGKDIFVSEHELNQWPSEAVSALKSQKLIKKSPPAKSIVCPGCEEACAMPVDSNHNPDGSPDWFVVCDKRSDVNRVPVSQDYLIQWRASPASVAKFVAESLSLTYRGRSINPGDTLEINIMKGKTKNQMLCLRTEKEMTLVTGSNDLPIVDVTGYSEGRFTIDRRAVERLVDSSTTSDPRYTSSNAKREARKLDTEARYRRWKKECRSLKKKHPDRPDNWCAIKISKMEMADGRALETIRKNMK